MALLQLAASSGGLSLAAACRATGLAKPTAHRLLTALETQGLLSRDPQSLLFHLGPETYVLGRIAAERYGIHRAARPGLQRLSAATGDTSFLTVRRDWQSVCVSREEGPFPIRTHALRVGDRHPLGVGAGSMAILAAMSDAEAEAAIEANAAELRAKYPSYSREVMREDRLEARRLGYAFNPGRLTQGSCGVAVAVLEPSGACAGALSIAAIESRLDTPRRQEIAGLLRAEVERLQEQLARPALEPQGA